MLKMFAFILRLTKANSKLSISY